MKWLAILLVIKKIGYRESDREGKKCGNINRQRTNEIDKPNDLRWRYVFFESLNIQTGWSRTYHTIYTIANNLIQCIVVIWTVLYWCNFEKKKPDLKWSFFCNVQLLFYFSLSIYRMNQNLLILSCAFVRRVRFYKKKIRTLHCLRVKRFTFKNFSIVLFSIEMLRSWYKAEEKEEKWAFASYTWFCLFLQL